MKMSTDNIKEIEKRVSYEKAVFSFLLNSFCFDDYIKAIIKFLCT